MIVVATAILDEQGLQEASQVIIFTQPFFAGVYLGYRYQKSYGDLPSPQYAWIIAMLTSSALIVFVGIVGLGFAIVDKSNIDKALNQILDIGFVAFFILLFLYLVFHNVSIRMGFASGAKFYNRMEEATAKRLAAKARDEERHK